VLQFHHTSERVVILFKKHAEKDKQCILQKYFILKEALLKQLSTWLFATDYNDLKKKILKKMLRKATWSCYKCTPLHE